MVLVADGELMAPEIEAVAELAAARPILELSGVGPEADHAPGRLERGPIGAIRKAEVASAVAELLWKNNRGGRALMREIDPVVQTVDGVVDRVLRIGEGEAGEYHFPNVGFA